MEKLKSIQKEPRLYSFVISPERIQMTSETGKFQFESKIIPQSVCNIIAYDLDGAAKVVTELVNGKGLTAKHTNDEPLEEFLKLTTPFFEKTDIQPIAINAPLVESPTVASKENWIAYLKDEAKKKGYRLVKNKI